MGVSIMKTWNDVWVYLMQNDRNAFSCSQFYCSNPNEIAKAFWHGVLTVMELEHRLTREEANVIWDEICSS